MELLNTIMILAQEGGSGQGDGGGGAGAGLSLFIPMIIILVIFFWMTQRSQKKKRQEREDLIDNIQEKDDVITIGGWHGRVMNVGEDTFELRVDDKNDIRMTINKSAVSGFVGEEEEDEAA